MSTCGPNGPCHLIYIYYFEMTPTGHDQRSKVHYRRLNSCSTNLVHLVFMGHMPKAAKLPIEWPLSVNTVFLTSVLS